MINGNVSEVIKDRIKAHFNIDSDNIEYCPKCNAEWSGTSCGLDDCGWIGGEDE